MNIKSLFAPVAVAAFLAIGGNAIASPTAYTTQSSFLAAISGAAVDTFDDLDYTTSLATPQSRTAGAYSYTASVGPVSDFFPASDDGIDVWLASRNRLDTITFSNFSSSVRGVGGFFFGSDFLGLSTAATSLTITATDASGTSTQFLLNPSTSSFLGFVSTGALTSLTVAVGVPGTGEAGVWPTINNLTLGTTTVAAVPEPETYALMLGGLGLLGWMARRRKA